MPLDITIHALMAPFWLPGVALDLILDALDLILEALDVILEALELILEALGDILGMAWILSWPGDPEWAGLHSGSSGSSV